MKLPAFIENDLDGIHYAIRIFIGTATLWFALRAFGDADPLWAIISLIIVTEPKIETAWLSFKARIFNTFGGCAIGLFFLLFIPEHSWLFPIALTISVLLSTYVIRKPLGWRVAPITTAIIIAAGMSGVNGFEIALHRAVEVFIGSTMALVVAWGAALAWPPDGSDKTAEK